MLAVCETEEQFKERNDPAKSQAYWGAWDAYIKALYKTGHVVSGAGRSHPRPPRPSVCAKDRRRGGER